MVAAVAGKDRFKPSMIGLVRQEGKCRGGGLLNPAGTIFRSQVDNIVRVLNPLEKYSQVGGIRLAEFTGSLEIGQGRVRRGAVARAVEDLGIANEFVIVEDDRVDARLC